jgi:hypothetical protein
VLAGFFIAAACHIYFSSISFSLSMLQLLTGYEHLQSDCKQFALTKSRLTRLFVLPLLLFFTGRVDALFLRPPSVVKPYPSLQLATADRLSVPYRGIANDAGKAASLAGFALSLDAEFGALDKSTFLALQNAYCDWSETKSQVKWREGRRYTLLDFLPPLLQASSGLYFRSSRTKQPGLPSFIGGSNDEVERRTEQEVLLACNCWGFAWEVLFQADNADVRQMTISTADPTSAWRAFTGPGFDLIQSSRTQPKLLTDKMVRNRKLRGGDALLLWHEIPGQDGLYLDHVAIFLDKDVYYEKSGSGDRVPFRITTWEGLTTNWPPRIFYWEWRRLKLNNLIPSSRGSLRPMRRLPPTSSRLRPASETFGLDSQVTDISDRRFFVLSELRPKVAQLLSLTTEQGDNGAVEAHTYTGIYVLEDIVIDRETGRASLPRSAFTDLRLPRLPTNPYL